MLTFTRDDNNSYVVTANEKFIGRLYKKWYVVSWISWCFYWLCVFHMKHHLN